ncbi:hypothetical protein ACFWWA_19995 [Streptomyces goshikiensis]|uniref:hypothetical protein n=1 Tax=Streptomyces goshikiensis TaxID=1942 RepID=UPI00365FF22D
MPRPCAPSTAALPRPHRTGRLLLRRHRLAARGTSLYCAVSGYDNNIWHAGFDGTRWTGFAKTPTVVPLSGPAITSPNPDDLYFAYRSAAF